MKIKIFSLFIFPSFFFLQRGTKEWNGAWSDSSREWQSLTSSERAEVGLKVADDGEFWMKCVDIRFKSRANLTFLLLSSSFDDFCENFTTLNICRLINTSYISIHKTYHLNLFHGTWSGTTAGGCSNNKQTYLHNPQCVAREGGVFKIAYSFLLGDF
jgi:calpain-5